MTLGGFTMIRNGVSLDYCFEQCIQSMLDSPCDVVAVSVASGNEDDTEQIIRDWVAREPRLSVNIYEWPNPVGDSEFFVKWIQYARAHTPAECVIQLDADEVLHENSYGTIQKLKEQGGRFSACFHRYNFWRDAHSLIPHGVCCGHQVVRMAPQDVWLPSDGYHPSGKECIMMQREAPGPLEIMHYGFLRKPDAFFKKAKALQGYFFNTYDPRLEAVEGKADWHSQSGVTGWESDLIPFTGTHPERMKGWLTQRDYSV